MNRKLLKSVVLGSIIGSVAGLLIPGTDGTIIACLGGLLVGILVQMEII